MKTLELKDIAGYLPYELQGLDSAGGKYLVQRVDIVEGYLTLEYLDIYDMHPYSGSIKELKPILRPISDLCKTVLHSGREIVPIVELAKIIKNGQWTFSENAFGERLAKDSDDRCFGFFDGGFVLTYGGKTNQVARQYRLYDFLHELKIDYRGLISAGIAIDANKLTDNPYE
jgi:hypothetical protein